MIQFIFSKKFLIQLAIAIAIILVVMTGAYYYLKHYTRQADALELINLEGYDIVEAEAILQNIDLKPVLIDSQYLPEKKGGEIVDQEPIAGSMVKKERKIYLTIARYSSPMVKLPNVIDQTLPLAMAKLSSFDIQIGDLRYKSSDCTNCVLAVEVDGEEVEIGSNLVKGQEVNLVVGEGETGEMVAVPLLIGLSINEAQILLNRTGLNLGATPCPDCETEQDSLAAKIYRHVPRHADGSHLNLGGSIDVYLTSDESKIPEVNVDSTKAQIQ